MEQKNNEPGTAKGFDYRSFLFKAISMWYLYVIGITIGLVYVYYSTRYYVPTYYVDARILVKDEYSSWGQEYFLPGMELVSARNRLVNEIGVIRSYPVINRTIKNLHSFRVFYYDHGNIKTTELYKNTPFVVGLDSVAQQKLKRNQFFIRILSTRQFELGQTKDFEDKQTFNFGDSIQLKGVPVVIHSKLAYKENFSEKVFSFKINDLYALTSAYQNGFGIAPEEETSSILIISRKGPQIQKEIDFLNELITSYKQQGLEASNQIASNTIRFVDEQIDHILDTLIISEQRLQEFKTSINTDRISLEQGTMVEEIAELEKQRISQAIQIRFYEETLEDIKNGESKGIVVPGSLAENATISKLNDLNSLLSEFYEAGITRKEGNNFYENLKIQIERSRQQIIELLTYELKFEKYRYNEIQQQITQMERRLGSVPRAERNYVNLQRNYKLYNDLYTYLLQKKSEASIAKASNISRVQVLDFATPMRVQKIQQNTMNLYLMVFFLGLLLPSGIVFLINKLNTLVIDRKDLERYTQIPVLGVVGHSKEEHNLVVFKNSKSLIAEAFRTIRAQIGFLTEQKDSVVILLTSSISGEGKTFCSMNLASAYASLGKKTILIGADLRRPKIYQDFNISNDKGLSDYLVGSGELKDVLSTTEYDNIDIMTSGPVPPNPSELLGREKMRELMTRLKEKYDVIIIDTPPIGLVSDALILQPLVDVNLYLVRHKRTNRRHLEIVNEYFAEGKIKNIGIIINDVKPRKIGYGGYYGYGYGYGYGYVQDNPYVNS